MRKMVSSFIALILTLSFGSYLAGCASFSSSKNVEIKDFKEVTLSNGLPVLLMNDKSLPYVSFLLLVKSGSASDPEGQKGISNLVAKMLERGTAKRSAEEMAESFDVIGASFSTSVSNDYATISASGLSFHQKKILDNFAEAITEPSFSMKEIKKVRALTLANLTQSVDDPSSFVSLAMSGYLYGQHPYGTPATGTMKDIKRMKKRNLIRHYLAHYRPNNAHLAVVGNFGPDIVKELEGKFKDWKKRKTPDLEIPGFPKVAGLNIQLIDKKDLKQSQIRFGTAGVSRSHPDYLKIRLANTILGGAFSSRLVNEIRRDRGLTYSIYSQFDVRKEEGPFLVSTFTRHEKVKETIEETLKVLNKFHKEGVTDQEVQDAKGLMRGSFPRSIETPESLARNLLLLRYYGISDDYLKSFITNINKISASEVNATIKKHFNPENMKVLVYSSRKKVMSQLKSIEGSELNVVPYKRVLR